MNFFKQLKAAFHPERPERDSQPDLSLAKAVILIEMAEYDEDFEDTEKRQIFDILKKEFDLGQNEVKILFAEAQKYRRENPDIFYSTRQLNDSLSYDQKLDFMVQVWKVVLADGKIDYSEDVLTRKLIQLLRLDRSAWILSRDRAITERGVSKHD